MDDNALLAECDVHIYKASGPGGQHRNKVSSAVRLRHRPSEVTAVANDSRSQHTNRRNAVRRLRVNIACRCRTPRSLDPAPSLPEAVASCFFVPTKGPKLVAPVTRKLQVGKKDVLYDLGCGDGLLAAAIGERIPRLFYFFCTQFSIHCNDLINSLLLVSC